MVKHIRYFAHGNGSLCINMRNLESPIPGYDRTILTWSWCKICQQVTPVVPLSFECWSLSFAKYLELRFYGSEYTRRASAEPCGHSLHHDHYQYFSFANMAASFKYRPISLHEIVLPAYTVTIGNQRKPQHLMDEVSEIYEKIGTVTITIMDRIGELRSEDSGVGNASRESKIKEFLSELQKEQSNLHDCIHVVKSKIELLIAKKKDSPTPNETHSFINIDSIQAEQSTSLLNTSGESTDPCVEKDGDTGGVNVSGTSGGGSGCTSGGNGSEMSCEEVHLLMVDIGKKLFHLKKSICEIVESWNSKLQEFITQDRKKEKGLVRSTSPTKVTPASNDITEYYLYGDENPPPDSDAINQPKTIMHMHPEPISEVFLTDGTILRQTYLGTTPRSGSPFEQTQKNNQVSSSITRKLSANMQIDNKEKAGSCDPTSPLAGKTNTDASSKLGSPYQVIKCPLVDDVDPAESASKLINEEKGSEKNMKPPMLSGCVVDSIDKGETSSHEDVEPITIETIRQNDMDGFYSDSEQSLKVEYNSDRGEFSDNHSMDSDEDIESNFPESEVYSDCEMAEEDSGVDTILIGQSAVDFASRKYSRDPLCSKRRLRGVSYLSGFTEFPKIKEESIGKIQYLTTKEVKVMQVQRRLRTEWESRIRIALDADAVRSDSPPYSLENSPTKGKSCSLESAHLDTPLSKPQLIRVSSSPSADIVTKKAPRNRQSNPLIKRLLQSSCEASELCDKSHIANTTSKKRGNSQGDTLESTLKIRSLSDSSIPDIEGMSELFKKTNSTNTNQDDGTFSPTQPDSGIERSAKTMESPSPFLSPIAHGGRIDDTSSEPSQQSSEFTQQKGIGHRRMKSAPPKPVNNVCDVEIPSELNREAPFIFLQSKHVQLSKMAEQLCQDERRDDERDIPEVLQFEGLNKNITSKTAQMQEDAIDSVSTTGKPKSEIGDVTETRSTAGDVLNKRGGGDKMKKMITNLLTSATFQPIPRPFPSWEQYMPQVGGTAPIVINEKEPTSLIAFTLSSQDFLDQLHTIQDLMAGKKVKRPLESTPTTSQPASPDIRRKGDMLSVGYTRTLNPSPLSHGKCEVMLQNTNNWNGTVENVNINDALEPYQSSTSAVSYIPEQPVLKSVGRNHPLSSVEFDSATDTPLDTDDIPSCEEPIDDGSCSIKSGVLDDSGKKKEEVASPDFHIKLQFQNNNAKFYCSVYYAEQFRQLRELIFPEGEERFIQSLARCKFWKATGGKSGSSFSKSLDDRFVMKQMSRLEVQSFVDFGPRYFAYINKAVKEKRPTAIAKLLGVYRIGFKNSVTNTTMRQDVLVMENLFYNKKVSKIYDLKGSVRSRYVQSSTKEDVLMDENLLETICDSPLFIRPHGKAVLSKAIFNDTEFLSTNMVMDYSLLVGIDEVNSKLVVGIIDYIRTYTWDKKLESYVKSTGILGGQGKMPTVVSPDVYRLRFTAAMTQHYFLMVPDKWTGFGEDIS